MTNVHLLCKESISILCSLLNNIFDKLKENKTITSLNTGMEVGQKVMYTYVY